MLTDLVRTTTADGLRLDGILQAPDDRSVSSLALDAVLCLHGVASNFYGATLLEEFVAPCVAQGLAVLRVNTRGHDIVTPINTPRGPRRLGAAYETIDDCHYDVTAWLQFLAARGYSRVALLGHSLGAIKAVYAAAEHAPARPACVIAASPPRLSYSLFMSGPQRADFSAAIQTAEQFVAAGQPQALFEAKVPFPLLVGAAHYLDKYGPGERYDLLKFASRIPCPALLVYGGGELERGGIAFAGLPEALRAMPPADKDLELAMVPEADHFYTGARPALVSLVLQWLSRRLSNGA